MGTDIQRTNKGAKPVPRSMKRAVVVEYMKDFDLDRVARMFDTSEAVIRRVVNGRDMQDHLKSTLGEVEALTAVAARRLLEALLEEAFEEDSSKQRTEARKLLARHFLPRKTESVQHHKFYIETPTKMTPEGWKEIYAPDSIQDAEIIEEDEDEERS